MYISCRTGHTVFMNHKSNLYLNNFIKCGIAGWCLEILFTSSMALRRREMTLKGTTSIWMFPIYGLACLFSPICRRIQHFPAFVRGCFYTVCIFFTEYTTGSLLRHFHACPWNYSHARFQIRGCIYALMIFTGEFLSGRLLQKHRLCPWDYTSHHWNIQGIIRLDFFPYWFATGLFFEKLLTEKPSSQSKG